jgi:glycosyltransferase involved in cell wall biosynthesis
VIAEAEKIRLAIVLPVFKHSMLVAEAIESALNQATDFDYRIVIINDGCPFLETDLTCSSYALAQPNKVIYLKKRNGGLSAARNSGIEYALSQWADLNCIYFLDADNRLHSKALQHGYNVLKARDFTGWAYPDIDMFGYPWNSDFSGEYCKLTHLGSNICEAGSMVSRRLLDKGVRFDENMKLGYEDWDFWLSAIEAGESGTHCPSFGFQYRKRAESMLTDSNRDNDEILSYIRRKHAPLYKQNYVLRTEHNELPRYAILLEDSKKIIFATDPRIAGKELDWNDLEEAWWSSATAQSSRKFPSFIIVTCQRILDLLNEQGLLHWVLWRLEDSLASGNAIALSSISNGSNPESMEISSLTSNFSGNQRCADIAMIASRTLHSAVVDASTDWMHSVRKRNSSMSIFELNVQVSIPPNYKKYHGAVAGLLHHYTELRESEFANNSKSRWGWKDAGIPSQKDAFQRARDACRIPSALYPRLQTDQQRDVAFILPLLQFGGVEKVALNVAREMASHGWRITIVIMDSQRACINKKDYNFIDSVIFFDGTSTTEWSGRSFYGTRNDIRAELGDMNRLYGLLASMDLVINNHSAMASGAMSQLRRRGIKTANYLHVTDLTPQGRAVGFTYLGLAYEHAYDYFLTCSNQLASWLHGMGVPEDKVVAVPNGPGYPIMADSLLTLLGRKKYFSMDRKLRILFIGRFDAQKGLERALDLAAYLDESGSNVEWRFVGGNVIDQLHTHPRHINLLKANGVPPAYETEAITEHYLWADILFLPSRWEGLPLTIIEAMRLGCVPFTTGVGAIEEVVENMKNGITLKEYRVEAAAEILGKIVSGEIQLEPIAANGIASISQRSWETINAFPLLNSATREK